MSDRGNELANRRKALQSRSAAQRAELREIRGDLQHALRFVDRGIGIAQRMTSAPVLLLVGLQDGEYESVVSAGDVVHVRTRTA